MLGDPTFSGAPLGFSTTTSTSPFPAPNVSTVNRAGAPTTLPFASRPAEEQLMKWINRDTSNGCTSQPNLNKKGNFVVYIADRKAITCIQRKLFLLRCVKPPVLPLVRCYSIRLPHRVASWVNYNSQRTESSGEHFASDLSLLKADAWCTVIWK